ASRFGDFDREAVTELFRILEFRNLLGKLPAPPDDSTTPAPQSGNAPDIVQTIVTTREGLDDLVRQIEAAGAIALDVETDSTEPLLANLVGISIATSPTASWY